MKPMIQNADWEITSDSADAKEKLQKGHVIKEDASFSLVELIEIINTRYSEAKHTYVLKPFWTYSCSYAQFLQACHKFHNLKSSGN